VLLSFGGGSSNHASHAQHHLRPLRRGKTTYAHALARREGAVAFVLDEWGVRLFGPDVDGPLDFGWMLERLAAATR
jgi:hypothetical protein